MRNRSRQTELTYQDPEARGYMVSRNSYPYNILEQSAMGKEIFIFSGKRKCLRYTHMCDPQGNLGHPLGGMAWQGLALSL